VASERSRNSLDTAPGVVEVTVEDRCDEDRLSALSCIDEWDYVVEADAGHVYVAEFTAPDLLPHLADEADGPVGICGPEIDGASVSPSFVGPQETIANTAARTRSPVSRRRSTSRVVVLTVQKDDTGLRHSHSLSERTPVYGAEWAERTIQEGERTGPRSIPPGTGR
jgi:hypothetical protein